MGYHSFNSTAAWNYASKKYNSFNSTETWDSVKNGASKVGAKIKEKAGDGYQVVKQKIYPAPTAAPTPAPTSGLHFSGLTTIALFGIGTTLAAGVLAAKAGTGVIDPRLYSSSSQYTSLEVEMQTSWMGRDEDREATDNTSYEPIVDTTAI